MCGKGGLLDFLRVADNAAMFVGVLQDNSVHRHHAMQLAVSLDSDIDVYVHDELLTCRGILLQQNLEHRIEAHGQRLVVVLFEPIKDCAERVDVLDETYRLLDRESCDEVRERALAGSVEELVAFLRAGREHTAIDSRVQYILRHIEREESCRHDLAFFSRELNLSKSRITHLFRDEVGVTLAYYALWKRVLFAVDSFRSVDDFSQIALDCGFSDLSHLSRAFRKMFGTTLSVIFRDSSSVQVSFEDSV